MRITIDYGIDLGTTNSTIAKYKGAEPILLNNLKGESLMPSIVHVSKGGEIMTGEKAKKYLMTDPLNTSIEFKRLMGTQEEIKFPASGKNYKAEVLSSFILKSLVERIKTNDGYTPKGAVITIPAMFQLPQCEATRKAAQLAGIEYAPLLQEPIAAAIAHANATDKREGYWLIYDLGGGTFDVSLVRSKGGRLQVLDHDGNNHLGGKDLDRLVAQQAVQIIRKENNIEDFKRSNPLFVETFSKLKSEAERVRIQLSKEVQDTFKIEHFFTAADKEPFRFEMEMDRAKLEDVISGTILRTTNICKEVLVRNKLRHGDVNGVVMVGGPTLTPCLSKIIQEELSIEAKHYLSPMNIVAFGAAIFASTQKLPKSYRMAREGKSGEGVELLLEFEAMTTNPNPLVIGRVINGGGSKVCKMKLYRSDKQFETSNLVLDGQGAFSTNLELIPNCSNLFYIELKDEAGKIIKSTLSEINIIHGLSVGAPPLSQSIGVMLANNSVAWYIQKGTALPAQNKMSHATTVSLKRGQSGEAINVPVIQGESNRADRNRIIGILKIFTQDISLDLPVGSEIQVELSIDEFSHTKTRAYVPLLDQWFEDVVKLTIESKSEEEVSKEFGVQINRLSSLSELADQLSEDGKVDVDDRVKDIESLLEEGDNDAIHVADQMLREMTQKLDKVEDINYHQKLSDDFTTLNEDTRKIIAEFGKADEEKLFKALEEEFGEAMQKGEMQLAEEKKGQIRQLFITVYSRTDEFWIAMFYHLIKMITDGNIGGSTSAALIREGNQAIENSQFYTLNQVCLKLSAMLPEEEQDKLLGVTSSII